MRYLFFILCMSLSAGDDLQQNSNCDNCHLTEDWKAGIQFDHDQTNFQLLGRHKSLACSACHTGDTVDQLHEFSSADPQCSTCHIDPHSTQLGYDCSRCHLFSDWLNMNWRDAHDGTFFPLLGAHRSLDCVSCHKTTDFTSDRLDFRCASCHLDQYVGVAEHDAYSTTFCDMCHNPFAWSPAQIELHDIVFSIYSGAHRGKWTTCEGECHINPGDYDIFSCGLNGVCHKHDEDKMNQKHNGKSGYAYESERCYSCHH